MSESTSIIETMLRRFSTRTFSGEPLGEAERGRLARVAESLASGPFGTRLRFRLLSAGPGDERALKGLGTYGNIRGEAAFLAGAAERGPRCLEDFGYAMEALVLEATALGLGTCWVGGLFTRRTFARRLGAGRRDRMPAVTAVGQVPDRARAEQGLVRRAAGGSRRKPWGVLFRDGPSGAPLAEESAGPYARVLEMVRWAPSASNRQPWRIVKDGTSWHFFLRRTPGYPPRAARIFLGVEDLQRVDIGIALLHFERAAGAEGLGGRWVVRGNPPVALEPAEYEATWEG